jgi:FtsP/CotA-like multicopper oxidase with cupredoxin domain
MGGKMKYGIAPSARTDRAQEIATHGPSRRSCLSYGRIARSASVFALSFALFGPCTAAEHLITLTAEETAHDDGLGNKLLAYKMVEHKVDGVDITSRYSSAATIPGPTIFLTEGDIAHLTIENNIPGAHDNPPHVGISSQVSIHVHGVHYQIDSDGTLKVINRVADEGAGVGPDDGDVLVYPYTWNVAPGTAGTWAYHDHNYMTHNGAEQKGLFGAIIVNPAGAPQYDKEYLLYVTDDAFWGMEIDGASKTQTKHGVNPSLSAARGDNVRFHLISLGTDIHEFRLNGYRWADPGTSNMINQVAIGPLEKHVFEVIAKHSTKYKDKNFTNNLMGMRGEFNVE